MPPEWLSMREKPTAQGFERTLLYGRNASVEEIVAILYINVQTKEAMLGWPLGTPTYALSGGKTTIGLDASLMRGLLDRWIQNVLPDYGYDVFSTTGQMEIEFYVSSDFYKKQIAHPIRADKIIQEVNGVKITKTDRVGLLLLRTGKLILELTFDYREYAVQCVCLFDEARLRSIIPLFRTYHANEDVRAESEISLKAFSDPSKMSISLNALSPIPVV